MTCQSNAYGKYGRLLGFCVFADGTDLNGWLVRQGHVLAYRWYSMAYAGQENAAKAERVVSGRADLLLRGTGGRVRD